MKDKEHKKLFNFMVTTTKQLLWLFAINGILWIWCSYILAFMGQAQIAESLSSTVCTIIIGQFAFYIFSKTVENLSKYNPYLNGTKQLKGKNKKNTEPEDKSEAEVGPDDFPSAIE